MNYYLYEIKNLVNNKVYVGVHKTKKLDDGYMGSGKVILAAIKKHGIENFSKTILETFETSEAMFAREKEVVTDEFLARSDVYNLRRGGFGGFDLINKEHKNVDIEKQRLLDPTLKHRATVAMVTGAAQWWKQHPEQKRKSSQTGGKVTQERHGSYFVKLNKDMSFQETKKLKFAEIGHQQGNKNSQFGSMWITDGYSNKKIKKDSLIPEGWKKGRVEGKII